jgi:hypothetical protein
MGAVSRPTQIIEGSRGHNIPHYSNVERVAEAGYAAQPFAEGQTIFHMPPEKTQLDRIAQFRKELKLDHPVASYNTDFAIFDGLAREKSYQRLTKYRSNIIGKWLGHNINIDDHSLPENPEYQVSVNVSHHTPIRLSIAAAGFGGSGGGEQIELRVDDPLDYASFIEL